MPLLDNHLEQIVLSATSIGALDFPPPRIFTNALLGQHEITTLIRDTEPHERALFSVDSSVTNGLPSRERRNTLFSGNGQGRRSVAPPAQQRQSSAVAKVLGNDMLKQIQQSSRGHGKRGVNIEVLLQGAERLSGVYAVDGINERISAIRMRYSRIAESVERYEEKVTRQQVRLGRINSNRDSDDLVDDFGAREETGASDHPATMTEDDLRTEQEEVRELERKKKALEERVAGLERDLGGLLR